MARLARIDLQIRANRLISANKGLPLPLGRGVCETKPRKPLISRVFCAQRGIETMVSDHGLGRGGRPWGRGRSGDFHDSRESFQGSRTDPFLCESRFGGGVKIAIRRFEAIRNSGKIKTYTGTSPPLFSKKAMPWGKKWPVQMNLPFFAVKAYVPGGSRIRPKKIRKMPSGRYRYQNLLFQQFSLARYENRGSMRIDSRESPRFALRIAGPSKMWRSAVLSRSPREVSQKKSMGWLGMSGRRASGTSTASLGAQVLALFFFVFSRENHGLKMSGKTAGSPRHPSTSHPRPA